MVFLYVFFALSMNVNADAHSNKKVSVLHAGDFRGCFFFTLEGVSLAASSHPSGGPWFAVRLTSEPAKNIFSMLLTAKALNKGVNVDANSQSTCGGHAEIVSVSFQ